MRAMLTRFGGEPQSGLVAASISQARRRVTVIVAVVVVLAIVAGAVVWQRYGVHNIFDAILDSEWSISGRGGNPALSSEYQGGAGYGTYKQQLFYYDQEDGVYIQIRPDHDPSNCSENGCKTTLLASKLATEMSIDYSERLSDGSLLDIMAVYDRHWHTLHEYVAVRQDDTELDADGVTLALAKNGITIDYLEQKRDWLLNEKVLPDFLVANPTVVYSVNNWGRVHIVTDRFLS